MTGMTSTCGSPHRPRFLLALVGAMVPMSHGSTTETPALSAETQCLDRGMQAIAAAMAVRDWAEAARIASDMRERNEPPWREKRRRLS